MFGGLDGPQALGTAVIYDIWRVKGHPVCHSQVSFASAFIKSMWLEVVPYQKLYRGKFRAITTVPALHR